MNSGSRKLNVENARALRELRNEFRDMKEEIKKLKKMKARFESLEARIFARQAVDGVHGRLRNVADAKIEDWHKRVHPDLGDSATKKEAKVWAKKLGMEHVARKSGIPKDQRNKYRDSQASATVNFSGMNDKSVSVARKVLAEATRSAASSAADQRRKRHSGGISGGSSKRPKK
jgi:hypothetical protein